MRNSLWGELAAEFIGTMIILLFGSGVCAMVVLFAVITFAIVYVIFSRLANRIQKMAGIAERLALS